MSTRIDFYILKTLDEHTRQITACKIIEKAYLKKHKIYVLINPNDQMSFDNLLWVFKDTSFIPHEIWQGQEKSNSETPIYIGNHASPPPRSDFNDILLNFSQEIPEFFKDFSRIIEVVSENPEIKKNSREKYRLYREKNCVLHTHTL